MNLILYKIAYSLNMGLVKQVGPPSHPIHKELPSNVCTFTPFFSRAFFVFGKLPAELDVTDIRLVRVVLNEVTRSLVSGIRRVNLENQGCVVKR